MGRNRTSRLKCVTLIKVGRNGSKVFRSDVHFFVLIRSMMKNSWSCIAETPLKTFRHIFIFWRARSRLQQHQHVRQSQPTIAQRNGSPMTNGSFSSMRWRSKSVARFRPFDGTIPTKTGYLYSRNGPHSLFHNTIRPLRSLAVAHHRTFFFGSENRDSCRQMAEYAQAGIPQHSLPAATPNWRGR